VTHPLASGAAADLPAAAGGRPQAADSDLSVLFRQHHADLVRLAVLLVGDQETAEDVVQDVFARLHARGAWRDRRREVLVLRYYLGLSESEIASVLRISPGTVKSTAARGIAALARMLGEES